MTRQLSIFLFLCASIGSVYSQNPIIGNPVEIEYEVLQVGDWPEFHASAENPEPTHRKLVKSVFVSPNWWYQEIRTLSLNEIPAEFLIRRSWNGSEYRESVDCIDANLDVLGIFQVKDKVSKHLINHNPLLSVYKTYDINKKISSLKSNDPDMLVYQVDDQIEGRVYIEERFSNIIGSPVFSSKKFYNGELVSITNNLDFEINFNGFQYPRTVVVEYPVPENQKKYQEAKRLIIYSIHNIKPIDDLDKENYFIEAVPSNGGLTSTEILVKPNE